MPQNFAEDVDDFKTEVLKRVLEYENAIVHPYTRALTDATKAFEAVIKKQQDRNKALLDLTLTALSLAGGALLTRVFAQTAVKTIAADAAMNFLANSSLERTYQAADLVATSPVAKFLTGKLWDTGAAHINGKIKEKLTASVGNFPGLKSFKQDPLKAYTCMKDFVNHSAIIAYETAQDIETWSATEGYKSESLRLLKGSAFYLGPYAKIDETELAKDIEMIWWMEFVLSFDHARTVTMAYPQNRAQMKKFGGRPKHTAFTPVQLNPSSMRYPAHHKVVEFTKEGVVHQRWAEVVYDTQELGGVMEEHIDKLYREREGRQFFQETEVGKKTLLRAEQMLEKLREKYHREMLKLLKAA